jgi:iron complex transport system substrate-binding protein
MDSRFRGNDDRHMDSRPCFRWDDGKIDLEIGINRMRVLSLLPASTEIIAALHAGDSIVGITHECDFPADVVRTLPRVTRSMMDASLTTPREIDEAVRGLSHSGEPLYMLDEAAIASLVPDLIVTQALCEVCAVSETDVRAIAARMASHPEVITLSGATWSGVADDMRRVGVALGCAEAAAEVVEALEKRIRDVHQTLRAARAPRPNVVVIEWTDPIFAAGHWVPELVRRAGGHELMSVAGEHSTVRSVESIRAARPELLIVAPCGYDAEHAATAARELLAQDDWAWAGALPLWAVDANSLLSRPGPRLVDGIETLAAIMHPDLFRAAPGSNAIRVA